MTDLENKQIKGVTGKLIVWIIIATASICSTCLGTYFGIKSQIERAVDISNAKQEQIDDLKSIAKDGMADHKKYDLQINAMQVQVNILQYQVNELEAKQNRK